MYVAGNTCPFMENDLKHKISPIDDIDHNSRVKIDTLETKNVSLKEQLKKLKLKQPY